MSTTESLRTDVAAILDAAWNSRDGRIVPKTDDLVLRDGAVELEATVLYADLANSTMLARKFPRPVVAKVVRAYLSAMTRLVRHHGGEVRSFDGDRVMGVFVGEGMNSSAARCALRMNWALIEVLRPMIGAKFPSLEQKGFVISHCAGVHRSQLQIVRAGIRDNNDLVFVGSAPNTAAALSDIRASPYHSYITKPVYDRLNDGAKLSVDGTRNRWQKVIVNVAGEDRVCYRSNWRWAP